MNKYLVAENLEAFQGKVLYFILTASLLLSPFLVFLRQYVKVTEFERFSLILILMLITISSMIYIFRLVIGLTKVKFSELLVLLFLIYAFIITLLQSLTKENIDAFYVLGVLSIFSLYFFMPVSSINYALTSFIQFLSRQAVFIVFVMASLLLIYKLDPLGLVPYHSFDVEFLPYLLIILLLQRRFLLATLSMSLVVFSSKYSYLVSVFIWILIYMVRNINRNILLFLLVLLFSSIVCLTIFYDFNILELMLNKIRLLSSSLYERIVEVIIAFERSTFFDYIFGSGLSLYVNGNYNGLEFLGNRYVHNSIAFLYYCFGFTLIPLLYFCFKRMYILRNNIVGMFVLFSFIISIFKLSIVTEPFVICLLAFFIKSNMKEFHNFDFSLNNLRMVKL